jgi:hypothetical protein
MRAYVWYMHIHTLPLVVVSPSILDIAPHVLRLPVALMPAIRAYPNAEDYKGTVHGPDCAVALRLGLLTPGSISSRGD